jgi:hypothetical protein
MSMLPPIRFGEEIPTLPPGIAHVEVTVVSTPRIEALAPAVMPSIGRADLLDSGEPWEAIRDYVVRKIEERWGRFPRNAIKEASVFKSFALRWGERAMPIARIACEEMGCIWESAPISVNRFCKGSDPYFAAVLAQRV